MTLFLPAIKSAERVAQVFMHEVIAHKGIKELVGAENFAKICDRVWKGMMPNDQKAMMDYVVKVNGAKAYSEEAMRLAADEYMAHIAEQYTQMIENGETDKTLLDKIEAIFETIKEFLDNLLGVDTALKREDVVELIAYSTQSMMANNAEGIARAEVDNVLDENLADEAEAEEAALAEFNATKEEYLKAINEGNDKYGLEKRRGFNNELTARKNALKNAKTEETINKHNAAIAELERLIALWENVEREVRVSGMLVEEEDKRIRDIISQQGGVSKEWRETLEKP